MGVANKHRNDAFSLIQRGGDFNSDKIVRIFKTRIPRGVARVQPTLADDGKYDITVGYALVEDANEIETRGYVVDV
jgi:hypothetical protein